MVSIDELYNTYSDRLYFTSLRIVGNTYDAEEIMQDTFLKYYHFSQKEEIREIRKWLTSICIRKSIDMLRSKNRLLYNLEELAHECSHVVSNESSAYENMLDEEQNKTAQVEKIKESLHSLPDKYRLILSLHLFEGYDYTEIEQITGIKEGSVRSLYMRGKAKLLQLITLKQKNDE